MRRRTQFWLWPNLLSLDAPLVALAWQVLFLRCFHAGENMGAAALLTVAVWLIYTADRTLDAWRGAVATPRHEFYRRHWRALAPLWIAACALGGWIAWTQLPAVLWSRGWYVAAAAGVYLGLVHGGSHWLARRGAKEAAVGAVFAIGVSLAAWPMVRTAADVLAIAQFFALCWINCVAIEDWEKDRPARAGAVFAAGAIALSSVALLRDARPVLACTETASALGLMLLDRYSDRMSRDAVRVLADAVLLSPLLFLPLAGRIV